MPLAEEYFLFFVRRFLSLHIKELHYFSMLGVSVRHVCAFFLDFSPSQAT